MDIQDRNTIMRAIALIAEHGAEAAEEVKRELELGGLELWEVSEAASQLSWGRYYATQATA